MHVIVNVRLKCSFEIWASGATYDLTDRKGRPLGGDRYIRPRCATRLGVPPAHTGFVLLPMLPDITSRLNVSRYGGEQKESRLLQVALMWGKGERGEKRRTEKKR